MENSSDINPKSVKLIADKVARGIPLAFACESVGIEYSEFRRILEMPVSKNLRTIIANAKAKYIELRVKRIEKDKDWKASAWLLERLSPEVFRVTDAPQVTVQNNNTVLTDELMTRVRELAAADLAERRKLIDGNAGAIPATSGT